MAENAIKKDGIEVIKLSELIEVGKNYVSGKISDKEFGEFFERMTIRSYIPLKEKVILAMIIVNERLFLSNNEFVSYEDSVGQLYMDLFFRILLQGYAFIDCTERALCNYDVYDLLYPLFSDRILQFCQKDYEQCKSFINDSLNVCNLDKLATSLEAVEADELSKACASNKQLMEDLAANKDLIEKINNIAIFNDPFTKKVAEAIKVNSIEEGRNKNINAEQLKEAVKAVDSVKPKRGRKPKKLVED